MWSSFIFTAAWAIFHPKHTARIPSPRKGILSCPDFDKLNLRCEVYLRVGKI
jgi:hypothetical protein